MNRRVLCVDDETALLQALARNLGEHFEVTTASGGAEALGVISAGEPFAAIMTDFRMPGMNGVEFLVEARRICPTAIRLLLTGQAEMTDAVQAVNRGGIFRFLTKPCAFEVLVENLTDAVEHHRLITAERQLLEETLSGVVKVFTELLSVTSPTVFGRANRLRHYVRGMLTLGNRQANWRFELAAHLALIGCVSLPVDLVERVLTNESVTTRERRIFAMHPAIGKRLLSAIPRLESVAEIVGLQLARDLTEVQDPIVREGVEILQTAISVDERVRRGEPASQVLRQICLTAPPKEQDLLALFPDSSEQIRPDAETSIALSQLQPGMRLLYDAVTREGQIVVAGGQVIGLLHLERLRNFADTVGIVEPLVVMNLTGDSANGR